MAVDILAVVSEPSTPPRSRAKDIPTFDRFMNPTLQVLRDLGGSGTIQELAEKVPLLMGIPEDLQQLPHYQKDRSNQTEVEYRMAWARTYLKRTGFIENSDRGVWALTTQGRETTEVDPREVRRLVNRQRAEATEREAEESCPSSGDTSDEAPFHSDEGAWQQRLLARVHAMTPDGFERLCQRLLRECGFIEVSVTGKSGDGGIDGTGILRVQHLVSFQVLFQCKKYKDVVGPALIRDFRGAMVGRTDKGLFITTGTFSPAAQREAMRDGAPPLDLIDGMQLAELLKRLKLGVKTELVEHVIIESDWFERL